MNLIRHFQDYRRYRQTVKELSRLSSRELADIGITRCDIPAIASCVPLDRPASAG